MREWFRPDPGVRRTFADTWLCRRCGRAFSLRHPYKWVGQGKARRRVCLECLGAPGAA